jgi:ribosomal protein L11 methyltransferase
VTQETSECALSLVLGQCGHVPATLPGAQVIGQSSPSEGKKSKVSQEWVEVVIDTSADAGELLGMLGDPNVCGGWQENGTVRLYWPAPHWHPAVVPRLEAILKTLPRSPGWQPDRPCVAVRHLPAEDWNARWASSVRPLRVGRRFVIRPSWSKVELAQHEIELVIDPKQASVRDIMQQLSS